MIDFGFDISDYYGIDPIFGTMKDFEKLLKEAHKRDIKVILDMVLNHTSDQHPWFEESRSSLDNPKRDWYIWQNPHPEKGYPTNWYSFNGSSAWHLDSRTNQYYYATFDSRQPDLNWLNPEVRAEMYNMIRFWLQKGVDGFRLDAYNALGHDPEFRDNPYKYQKGPQNGMDGQYPLYTQDLPMIHIILQEIRAIVDQEFPESFLTGETLISSGSTTSIQYFGKNNDELHSPLDFNRFAHTPWAPLAFHKTIEEWELVANPQNWPSY
jgi:alpha-glucosidase